MSNGNNRLPQGVPIDIPLIGQQKSIQPGHVAFSGPLAAPVAFPAVVNKSDGQPVILTFGGLTKLESAAIQIAAGMATDGELLGPDATQRIASGAVRIAQDVLGECERVAQQQSTNNPTEQK